MRSGTVLSRESPQFMHNVSVGTVTLCDDKPVNFGRWGPDLQLGEEVKLGDKNCPIKSVLVISY